MLTCKVERFHHEQISPISSLMEFTIWPEKKNTEKIISAVALLEHELGEDPKDTGVRLSRWSIG